MDALFVTNIVLLILLFSLLSSTRSSIADKQGQRTPPLAKGAWPIVGHLPMLGGKTTLLHTALGAMADKYGPIFSVRLGICYTVVISNSKIAKECFTTNDIAFSSRPQYHQAIKHLGFNGAMFALAPYGQLWRELRKVSILELLSNRRIELLHHVRASEIEASVKELYQKWLLETKGGHGHALVDMKQVFSDMTSNIMIRMVAGKRYFGSSSIGNEEARKFKKAMASFFHLLGIIVPGDSIPVLRWFDLDGHKKAIKETNKELESISQSWLDEHKQRRGNCGKDHRERDFVDVLLNHFDGTKNLDGYDSDTIIKANAVLLAGGSDTTTPTLTWALSLLLNNPKVLYKAYTELDTHVGNDRQVCQSDIPNLVYLQAIVKETFRLYPATPLSSPRMSTKACTIGNYHIPAGTRLITNMYKIHRDPEVWAPDPLVFRPERFFTTQKDIDIESKCFELIPFGAGRRSCPGASLALQVLHLALANFLHAFEFTNPDDAQVDMTEGSGLTNMKVTPLNVLIKPRLSTHVYDQLSTDTVSY